MIRPRLFALFCLFSPCLLGGVHASTLEEKPTATVHAKPVRVTEGKPAPVPKTKSGRPTTAVKPGTASKVKQGKAVAIKPAPAARTGTARGAKPVAAVGVAAVIGKDERELVPMPWQARVAVRAEMRALTVALDDVMNRLVAGKVEEAGEIALDRMGVPVWGTHQKLPKPAQPEQYMPEAMRSMALEGYRAASDFATVARTGDRATAFAMLPMLTGSCAKCHESYRIR